MKKNIAILFLLISQVIYAQKSFDIDGFNIRFKKSVKVETINEFVKKKGFTTHKEIATDPNKKTIVIRVKIKSISKQKEVFDPNKFYLVSDYFIKRMRPLGVYHDLKRFEYIGKDETGKKYPKNNEYIFDENIKDTFLDYKIDAYRDTETILNFGTPEEPDFQSIYFNNKELKRSNIDVYFLMSKRIKDVKLYYGKTLIKEFKI
jgi:hypothetical protein